MLLEIVLGALLQAQMKENSVKKSVLSFCAKIPETPWDIAHWSRLQNCHIKRLNQKSYKLSASLLLMSKVFHGLENNDGLLPAFYYLGAVVWSHPW